MSGPTDTLDVLVIGAGQAGLAIGHHLSRTGDRFLIVDAAAEIGASWRRRWDSLRLFTPAQYDNLPGLPFPAVKDRYPTKDDVAAYLDRYAAAFDLPIRLNTPVTALTRDTGGTYQAEVGRRSAGGTAGGSRHRAVPGATDSRGRGPHRPGRDAAAQRGLPESGHAAGRASAGGGRRELRLPDRQGVVNDSPGGAVRG